MKRERLFLVGLAACGRVNGELDPDPPDEPEPPAPISLQVTVAGPGRVTSSPGAIDCGTSCEAKMAPGAAVTLTAVPDDGAVLVGWSGDCGGSDLGCALTMDAPRNARAIFARRGERRWASQVSFAGADFAESELVVDTEGNAVVAGTVSDDAGTDLYVAKLGRNDGAVLWEQRLATPSFDLFGGLASDAEGNVYAAMTVLGPATFVLDGQTFTADATGNIVVLRLAAASGEIEWVRQWGGTGQDRAQALAVSGSDLYAVGTTSSTSLSLPPTTLNGPGGFLLGASTSNGDVLRARTLVGDAQYLDLATNGNHVGLVGLATSTMTVDGCFLSLTGDNTSDGILIDFVGSTLECQWLRAVGSKFDDLPATTQAVAPFPGGGWVMTGGFTGTVVVASGVGALTSAGGVDAFAVRYDAEGQHVWSFRYGNGGRDVGDGIDVTPDGGVVFAGSFESAIVLGTHTLDGVDDVFVTRLSPGLNPIHEWAVALGGDDEDRGSALGVTANGDVHVLASFLGQTDVGGQPLSALDRDGWIVSLVR
jgi:hypothetical protein